MNLKVEHTSFQKQKIYGCAIFVVIISKYMRTVKMGSWGWTNKLLCNDSRYKTIGSVYRQLAFVVLDVFPDNCSF